MEPKILICYMEEDKFTTETYERQMAYLTEISRQFDETLYLDLENVSQLFQSFDVKQSICITTSSDLAAQLQGLGISVVGFEADEQEMMQAPYVVLGLDEVTYFDLCRIYQRWHKLPWFILETERCIVRELCMDDLPALRKMYEKEAITEFVEPLYEPEQERQYQENYIEKVYGFYGYGMWLVFEKNTDRLIGRAGVEYRDYCEEDEVELGYVMDPDVWRQGYATEVCQAIISYARDTLGMNRIMCRVAPENNASIRFLEKLEFTLQQKGDEWIYVYSMRKGMNADG